MSASTPRFIIIGSGLFGVVIVILVYVQGRYNQLHGPTPAQAVGTPLVQALGGTGKSSSPEPTPGPPRPDGTVTGIGSTTSEQHKIQQELETLLNSREYKALLTRQSRREAYTDGDFKLMETLDDLQGKLIKAPLLEKSTKFPPEDAKTVQMWEWWRKMKAADPAFEYKRPISFYGKVVDDAENAVANVTVVATIATAEGNEDLHLTTDPQGRFEFGEQHGKWIFVDMDKNGYGRGPKSYGTFEYAEFFSERFHQPDRNNPVVFVLPRLKP